MLPKVNFVDETEIRPCLLYTSALDMMQFMYLWLPLIFDVLIMFVLSKMNVEDANKKLKAEKGIAADEVTDALDIN